ncbi:MAG: hypothetical protein PG981_000935 [Wolbachia endosymbiont of Ctenocephalides orientis wCori]|nr:MAG: hypothetical protein PG981_000935 [Wolbachia endosymbiont of Ctenocephalides orientis wCori]
MKKLLLLIALIFSFSFDTDAAPKKVKSANTDDTSNTICKIVDYIHGIGGPMITVVIIGAALLAIFCRMPWPALFALGAFTAVFFGAPAVVKVVAPNGVICQGGAAKCHDGSDPDQITGKCK